MTDARESSPNGLQIHEVPLESVPEVLRSRTSGLRASEVAERRAELGPNVLSRPARLRWVRLLAAQLTNFFSLLLDAAAVLCFVADALSPDPSMRVLGVALFVVAVLNAGFSLAQHVRAERAMEKLRSLLPPRVRVRREGREERVLADELVPGDVVLVAEGDRIPADARLIEGVDLLVDNAPLTGESTPLARSPAPARGRAIEAPNTLFAGATILRGSGVGIVFATGRRTELGRIASLSEQVRRPLTPLAREIRKMVRTLTAVAVGMGVLFFLYGLAVGRPLLVNVVFALGILVANVPEGLLPTSTLALAVGGLRLARRRVLVRTLEAVESLGSVDVICTDKTGTLTLNRLSVTRVVGASGDELAERPRRELLETSLLACELRERSGALHGDPLDVAVAAAYSRHADDALAIVASVSERFAFDVHKRRAGGVRREGEVYRYGVKGAWESLRGAIHTLDGEPASEASLSAVDRTVRRLASGGYRVIAVASRRVLLPAQPAPPQQEALEQELTLEGFLCVEDPLRPEVPAAVLTCRKAGIRVIVVTGDHPDTARAIAERAGIVDPGDPERVGVTSERIVTGDVLEHMREPEVMAVLREGAAVFARTTPEQKMKIVLALKRLGHCVAMTGDGVNDAPALKAADVGVAMGQRGTDVARESAQIVLLDDNFASIVAGIEEGRTVFANLRKFTTYVLASNGPEIAPFLLYVVLPVPLALTIVQILWIDLGTDIVPSMALGQEPPDPDVMERPPRKRSESLLSPRLLLHAYGFLGGIEALYSLALFFYVLHLGGWRWGVALAHDDPLYLSATGITLATVMIMQVGNYVGCRSSVRSGLDRGLFSNRLALIGFAIEIALSFMLLYVPEVASLLGAGPVPAHVYALAWLGAPLIFVLAYLRKRRARLPASPS